MKKIIITSCILICNQFCLKAQTNTQTKPSATAATSAQIAQAKSHNGDPLVNGIPYSQYKAQQEALKQKQEKQKQEALQKLEADKLEGVKIVVAKPNN
jgi:hypothetical protein